MVLNIQNGIKYNNRNNSINSSSGFQVFSTSFPILSLISDILKFNWQVFIDYKYLSGAENQVQLA